MPEGHRDKLSEILELVDEDTEKKVSEAMEMEYEEVRWKDFLEGE